jgi:hypothetical protein
MVRDEQSHLLQGFELLPNSSASSPPFDNRAQRPLKPQTRTSTPFTNLGLLTGDCQLKG